MLILLTEVQINCHISLDIQTLFFPVFFIPLHAQAAVTATGELHFTQGSTFRENQPK